VRAGLLLVVVGFLVLNLLARQHAAAFTRFAPEGSRTARPEELGLGEKLRVLVTGPYVPRPRNRRTPADLGLAHTVHRFPGYRGIPLEAWHVPAPPPERGLVLLFHGHADCKASQLPVARALHQLGWSTFLVDFHGSGGSGGDRTSLGFHEATDVAAALHYSGAFAPGRRVLFGQSMGAAAVLKAVHDGGLDPHGIVLECPFDRFATTVERRFAALGVPAFPAANLLLFWGGRQAGFDPFSYAPVEDARAVKSPLLLLHGDADAYITVDEARHIAANARGRLEILEGVRHESYLAARPHVWRRLVGGFLAGL
jgi:alpha-beta hydrolase superfamily lysophospholipase